MNRTNTLDYAILKHIKCIKPIFYKVGDETYMKQTIKELLFKFDTYGFSQRKWFRKFYGGEWNKILIESIGIVAL